MANMFKKQKLEQNAVKENEKFKSDNHDDGNRLVETIMVRKLKTKLLQRRSEESKSYSPKSWVSIPDLPKTSLISEEIFPVTPVRKDGTDVLVVKSDSDGYVPLPTPDYSWYTKRESVSSVKESSEIIPVSSEHDFDEISIDLEFGSMSSSFSVNNNTSNVDVIEISDSDDVIPPSPVKNVADGLQSQQDFQSFQQISSERIVLQCPLCLMQFSESMQEIDRDGHIAQCLQISTEDAEW